MNKNRMISVIILALFLFSMLPAYKVQAVDDVNIISSTLITKDDAKTWAAKKNASKAFIDLADLYWKYSATHGNVNPAIAYAQSAKETAFGNFGGVLDASFHNPCGLKTTSGGDNYDPNAHKRFNCWDEGVQAHLDHLALYAGAAGYPRATTFDPRHFSTVLGAAKTVRTLGGKWAPSATYGDEILTYYGELVKISKSRQALIGLDTPTYNQTTSDCTLSVEGWALNCYGVKEVKVYLDDKYVAKAQLGISRPDVNVSHPGYINGAISGYAANINLTNIAPGTKKITVEALGNDGVKVSQSRTINVSKKIPIIKLDTPTVGSTVNTNTLSIKGWALNSYGVKAVQIYVDGKLMGNSQLGISRPDVNKAIPGYPSGNNSGYIYNLSLTSIAPGQRKISVQAIGNDGAKISNDIKINVVKKASRITIDSPKNGTRVDSNSLKIQGWALNASGVKQVKVFVDNKLIGNAQTGLSRQDVNKAMPGYLNGNNSGYAATINLATLAAGQRNIMIQAIGNDGTSISSTTKINVVKKSPRLNIDSPSTGVKVNANSIDVKGWALNASGVKMVRVYLDGKLMGNANIGISRSDVNKAVPGYPNGSNSGYSISISLSNVAGGQRNIVVEAVGNDGSSIKQTRTINVVKKVSRITIDTPINGGLVHGNSLTIQGWALNPSGVKAVNVYMNNILITSAKIGISRPDVNAAIPGYPNGDKSGYSASIDISKVAKGQKNIRVEAVGFDGTKIISNISTTVSKNMLVVVDPGHNFGGDDGAYSSDKKYVERELNMQVAVKLQASLKALGYDVVLTRQPWERPMDDMRTSLKKRADLANSLKADLFISLHHNSSPNSSANGMSVYYSTFKPGIKNVDADLIPLTSSYEGYTDTKPTNAAIVSRNFAKNVEEALTSKCGYGRSDSDSGRYGYIDRNLSVTVNTNMPSVLIELGYISNPSEAARCSDGNEQQKKADVISSVVRQMF